MAKIGFHFLLVLLVIGCASSNKINDKSKVAIPEWVKNVPSNTDNYWYAVGMGKTIEMADNSAIKNMSTSLSSYITVSYEEYTKSKTIGEEEFFTNLISIKTKQFSNNKLIGLQIIKHFVGDGVYYSLAQLDIKTMYKNRDKVQEEVNKYIANADSTDNAGKKLEFYLLALMSTVKTPFEIKVKGEDAMLYIYNVVLNILDNLDLKIIYDSKKFDVKHDNLRLNFNANSLHFSNIPLYIVANNQKVSLDFDNNYYYLNCASLLEYGKCKFTVFVDAEKISYPNLLPAELAIAKNIVKNILRKGKNIYFSLHIPKKIFVKIKIFIDGKQSKIPIFRSKVNSMLQDYGFVVVNRRSKADFIVESVLNSELSSHNQYLGYCYKSSGEIRIKKGRKLIKNIPLSSEMILEETKTYDKNRLKSARKSLDKLFGKIVKRTEKFFADRVEKGGKQ